MKIIQNDIKHRSCVRCFGSSGATVTAGFGSVALYKYLQEILRQPLERWDCSGEHQQHVQICCHRTINHGTPPARDATHTRTPGPGLKELQGMMLQGVSIDASTKGA